MPRPLDPFALLIHSVSHPSHSHCFPNLQPPPPERSPLPNQILDPLVESHSDPTEQNIKPGSILSCWQGPSEAQSRAAPRPISASISATHNRFDQEIALSFVQLSLSFSQSQNGDLRQMHRALSIVTCFFSDIATAK